MPDKTLEAAREILEQLGVMLPPGEPTIGVLLAAVDEGQQRIAAIEARLPRAMAQIAAELNGTPPTPRPKPLRIKKRKRAKSA